MWEFIPGVKVDIAEVERIFNRLKFALIREATNDNRIEMIITKPYKHKKSLIVLFKL